MRKKVNTLDNFSYYEGPRKNQYEGWSEEEIEADLREAFRKNEKIKSWDEALKEMIEEDAVIKQNLPKKALV